MSSNYNEDGKPRLSFYDRGPGPAGYTLPPLIGRKQHAPTHRINPEYSMGWKLGSCFGGNLLGPGPAEYGIQTGLKANGKFIGYEYTMRIKFPLINKKWVPAPNTYQVPPPEIIKPKAPAFVFGSRTPIYNKKVAPSPNTYLLPRAIGPKIPDKLAAAECTLKGDRKFKPLAISPGPIYDIGRPDLVKPRSAAFTMRIKFKDLHRPYQPGPATYDAELPKCPCKVPLGWHMGIRYNDFTGVFKTQCDKTNFLALD